MRLGTTRGPPSAEKYPCRVHEVQRSERSNAAELARLESRESCAAVHHNHKVHKKSSAQRSYFPSPAGQHHTFKREHQST